MYFIPQKGKLIRWAAHIRPIYRYTCTFICVGGIVAVWVFCAEPWLAGLVQLEEQAFQKVVREKQEACTAERLIAQQSKQLEKTDGALQEIVHAPARQEHTAFLLQAAQENGVDITSFVRQKALKKEWKTIKNFSLSAQAPLENIFGFLKSIAQSRHAIKCSDLSIQPFDATNHMVTFQLGCVSSVD